MLNPVSSVKCFGGQQNQYMHRSTSLNCDMHFSVFLPPQAALEPVPLLYWLSGLTCTDQNFVTKAGAQAAATDLGIAIVCPDTSPRGEGVPDDAEYDFGMGAGFYLNAIQEPWSKHYQMADYVINELPTVIAQIPNLDTARASISGHSMGGHGALTVGLTHPECFRSVSAFAPIVSPTQCPWGQKAFAGYLGDDKKAWQAYDACLLMGKAKEHLPILVDQGRADTFLEEQLKTEMLVKASADAGYPIQVRMQDGYDHSYFFIATFIREHLQFHSRYLGL